MRSRQCDAGGLLAKDSVCGPKPPPGEDARREQAGRLLSEG
jgi:hypothetical protein